MNIEREPSTEDYYVLRITMLPSCIRFALRNNERIVYSGADPLSSTNGCYDSLLSNVVNNLIQNYKVDEFIFSKG